MERDTKWRWSNERSRQQDEVQGARLSFYWQSAILLEFGGGGGGGHSLARILPGQPRIVWQTEKEFVRVEESTKKTVRLIHREFTTFYLIKQQFVIFLELFKNEKKRSLIRSFCERKQGELPGDQSSRRSPNSLVDSIEETKKN